ncbi:MAG: hypothetical protein EOO11_20510 [Chitinophagaceae bacterium]|nr:MAG: hypothetical protein EOO11_20510 [Chitinophagaceae bacterium]
MRILILFLLLLSSAVLRAQQPPTSAYRFSYSIDTLAGRPGYLRVHFRLHNGSDSVLHFLRRSCSFDHGLHWNERQWQHRPRVVCRASFPVIDTVAPRGTYEWTTYFEWVRRAPMPEFTYTLSRLKVPSKPRTLTREPLPVVDTIALRVPVPQRP